MKIENKIKSFKETYPNYLAMIKIGSFYHAYGKDSIILSYLFNYQTKKTTSSYSTCGFPIATLDKITMKLEELEINYIILENCDYLKIESQKEFGSNNKYDIVYNKSYNYVSKKNRIDTIYQFLLESIFDDTLKNKLLKIEEIIYEQK